MYTLPDLPYSYDALEPHIDAETVKIHHTKHHQGYTDKFNAALENNKEFEGKEVEDILQNMNGLPDEIHDAVRNNGGGYYNHGLFWTSLSPDGGGEPSDELAQAITNSFESFDNFKEVFNTAASTRFGSGWAWLAVDGDDGLIVSSSANQDNPLAEGNHPILGLDVWEHAYYLKYQNRRPEYVDAFWNIVDWTEVARRYQSALG